MHRPLSRLQYTPIQILIVQVDLFKELKLPTGCDKFIRVDFKNRTYIYIYVQFQHINMSLIKVKSTVSEEQFSVLDTHSPNFMKQVFVQPDKINRMKKFFR